MRTWDYLVEILTISPQGWLLLTDEHLATQPVPFQELSGYFEELGQDGWELVAMTAVAATDRVVVGFKRPTP